MPRKRALDVNAAWDDPFEAKPERRKNRRTKANFKATITAANPNGRGKFIGPALVRDLSIDGACVYTKHNLRPGDHVALTISTDFCPMSMGMPGEFNGDCVVTRVTPAPNRHKYVALHFNESFSQYMEFAVFFEYIETISGVMASP